MTRSEAARWLWAEARRLDNDIPRHFPRLVPRDPLTQNAAMQLAEALDLGAEALEALPVSEDEEEGAEMLDPHEGD